MQLTPFDLLPALESEPTCDWTFMPNRGTDHHGEDHPSLILIYAARRDYLSVPKTYAVVEFFGNKSCPLEIHQMPRDNYLDEINLSTAQLKAGLYELEAPEDSGIALLIDSTTALEIVYGSLIQHQEIYYAKDSKTALSEYIKQS
ncbi:MAG: hypothetical protein V7731_00200 [Amphritea sp.]